MAICRCCLFCCLTHGSCHWTQISSGYSDGGYQLRVPEKMAFAVHAISTSPAACAGLACVQHALAWPDSESLCCTRVYFLCDILWPEVQSQSDNSHIPATGPRSARALTQARPTVSCIHLVYMQTCVEFFPCDVCVQDAYWIFFNPVIRWLTKNFYQTVYFYHDCTIMVA